jgi:nitrate/nitrite-specific signal transduction histidine kinase
MLEQRRIGTLYLKSDMQEMLTRLRQYLGIVSLGLVLSLFAAFLVSSVLQHVISDPVMQLDETAGRVSAENNYSIRATKQCEDELGLLVDCFNEMMELYRQHVLKEQPVDLVQIGALPSKEAKPEEELVKIGS